MDLSQHPAWHQIVANVRAHKSGQLDLALATAEDGFAVFPVNPRTKAPYVNGGFKSATTDVGQIIRWWNRWPDALVGIPTGEETGIAVLDLDPGAEGWYQEFLASEGFSCNVASPTSATTKS